MDENEDEIETVDEWWVHLQSRSEDEDVDLGVGDKCDDDCDLRRTRDPCCQSEGIKTFNNVNCVKNISNKLMLQYIAP